MKTYIIIFFLSFTLFGISQTPIDINAIDLPYLEHLVKTKIDSVRQHYNCDPLINDSILYVAAKHHSFYMYKRSGITHFENEFPETKTPQLRAEHFGAKNYYVGENVLSTSYNTTIKDKKNKTHNTRTYEGLADAIVSGWVNSPGHFKNIITPEYQITGIAFEVHKFDRILYACQKFATVPYTYAFDESKEMFNYSNYIKPVPITSFTNIDSNLLIHEHEWKLKHDELELCKACDNIVASPPFVTMRNDNGYYRLKIEDSEYVKKLIKNRKDGFAVELVNFDDYMCGNDAYYTKPSRRNGQCTLNGRVVEPLYRKDLLRGYKKRKIDHGVKFLPFIFGKDSIPFFKRFYQYKLQRFSSEYFEINLGKFPSDLKGGYWAHNLIYIQDKQICHIDYFTDYQGETYMDTVYANFIPIKFNRELTFVAETKEMTFQIPFEVNKSDFIYSDIQPFIDSLSTFTYTIDSISILAFSSVEGDSVKNELLQQKRAYNIANLLIQQHSENIPFTVTTTTAWDDFREKVVFSPTYKYLANKSNEEILKVVNSTKDPILLKILKNERKAIVNLHCTINFTDENLWYFILKAWNSESKALQNKRLSIESRDTHLENINRLYEFTHGKVLTGIIDTSFLARLKLPLFYNTHISILEKIVMFGDQFPAEFTKNKIYSQQRNSIEADLISNAFPHIGPEFKLNFARRTVEKYLSSSKYSKKNIQDLLSILSSIRPYYDKHVDWEFNIDKLVFDLNMLLVDKVYHDSPLEFSKDASYSLHQIIQHYKKYGQWTAQNDLKIAQSFVYYQDVQSAVNLLSEYLDTKENLMYFLPLAYIHSSEKNNEMYYQFLLKSKEKMNTEEWCNLFLNRFQIPFQAFDHETTRNEFCTSCMTNNKVIRSLLELDN